MVNYNIVFILVVSTLCFVSKVRTSTSVIQKCCSKEEKLVFTREGINCTQTDGSDSVFGYDPNDSGEVLWWLPQDVINNETRTILNINEISYGILPDCEFSSMDVLRFDIGRNMAEFNLHVRDNEVHLDVLKDSSFHEPGIGRQDSFPPSSFCADATVRGVHVVILCPCRDVTCVRKCCHDGSVFDKSLGDCVDVEDEKINGRDFFDWVPKVDTYKEYYRLAGTVPKCDRFTSHVVTTTSSGSRLLLAEDGSLQDLDSDEKFRKDEYCGAHNTANEEMVLFCLMASTEAVSKQIVYGVLFLIGALCLLATVVVTVILPEMRRNIHGKMALAHNFMLFIGYLVTGISQIGGSTMSQSSCEAISLTIQFSILAAFFWLNVMCVDTSWTFSGIQSIKGSRLQTDRKKFIYYSLYAWGSTAIISTATLIVEYSPSITRFKPNFGTKMCFFNDRGAELLFFYGPMALLLAANLLLFIYIACKIPGMKQETKSNSNKQKLALYAKLFCLMGVTWVTEVISWAVGGPNYLWYFSDFINLFRAVFIFVIFCCKRKVYIMLRNKVLRAFGKDVPPCDPSLSKTSLYSDDSGKRTVSTATVLPTAERNLPSTEPNAKIPNQSQESRKTEAFEMKSL